MERIPAKKSILDALDILAVMGLNPHNVILYSDTSNADASEAAADFEKIINHHSYFYSRMPD